jgi:hypothetical protein
VVFAGPGWFRPHVPTTTEGAPYLAFFWRDVGSSSCWRKGGGCAREFPDREQLAFVFFGGGGFRRTGLVLAAVFLTAFLAVFFATAFFTGLARTPAVFLRSLPKKRKFRVS